MEGWRVAVCVPRVSRGSLMRGAGGYGGREGVGAEEGRRGEGSREKGNLRIGP
jgi:hypothetical protein